MTTTNKERPYRIPEQEGLFHDAQAHVYRFNGESKASVTDVLGFFKIGKNPFHTEAGRTEGTMLHAACEFIAENKIEWCSVHPIILGRARGYESFLSETRFEPMYLESPLYDSSLDLCTKPDQIGMLNGRLCIVEIKGGEREDWHALQTAGQQIIVQSNGVMVLDRYALYLRDYRYFLEPHRNRGDIRSFQTLVAAYRILERLNVKL